MTRCVKVYFFMELLVVVCSACGGGGLGAPIPMKATTSAPKTVQITQWGDSTTDGWYKNSSGNYVKVPNRPWQLLQASLQSHFGPYVTVQLSAQEGSTLRDMLNGTGHFTEPLSLAIKADTSQVETIKFGLNDQGCYDAATYQGYLIQAVQIMLAAGKKVVLEEPNPALNYQYDKGLAIATAVNQVAAQFSLPIVKSYSLTLAVPNWTKLMSDNLHPTQPLYQSISDEQISVLVPIVQDLLK